MKPYEDYPQEEWDAMPLEEKIRNIPISYSYRDGFSKDEACYQSAAKELKATTNWDDQRIFDFLRGLYWAAASEFGV